MTTPELSFYDMGKGVTAFSSTRKGGYSKENYGEFNINRYCGDSEEAIRKNRNALCMLLNIDDKRLLMPHQVHQTEIAIVDEKIMNITTEEQQQKLEGVDALMTDVRNVCIGVSTADCIPVLLYDNIHGAVCAVHAGWRGTVRRIVEKAVAKMTDVYGSKAENIVAQIGPGISLESFEVGDEVYDAFIHEGFNMETISRRYPTSDETGEKWHINLPECNRQQLISAGLDKDNITVSKVCTFIQYERYFSARRLGINSGRIFTGIMLF
jgi:uncharacterized protein, YfiH family